ncbi:MAG: oxidoreductase [Acidimicrobiales bacterium]
MVRWTTADIPDQTGRTILVTGANSGLGLRTAEVLAAAGAHVLMACRNQAKAADARDTVAATAAGPAPTVVALDLADLASVRACAEQVVGSVEQLDGLVNNAGVMAIPLTRTADGFEMQFGTNHLGHFALTGWLLPALLQADAPRVVTVSSVAHWPGWMRWRNLNWASSYQRWMAYSQSKLANLLFASELERRARAANCTLVSLAAHPGISATNLYAHADASGRGARVFGQSDAAGALPQLRALTDPGAKGNDYFGPWLEVRGHPRRATRSLLARRRKDAARLWERSEQLTGVSYDFAGPTLRSAAG